MKFIGAIVLYLVGWSSQAVAQQSSMQLPSVAVLSSKLAFDARATRDMIEALRGSIAVQQKQFESQQLEIDRLKREMLLLKELLVKVAALESPLETLSRTPSQMLPVKTTKLLRNH